MSESAIEWTDHTWNPVVGCTKVSQGCKLCYAKVLHDKRHAAALVGSAVAPQYQKPFEVVQLMPDRLDIPLRRRIPTRYFVNSVSDLFHVDIPDEFIAQVFAVMALARWHTFQVLTKRAERMPRLLHSEYFRELVAQFVSHFAIEHSDPLNRRRDDLRATTPDVEGRDWPLRNVWLGVSVENQAAADERLPFLEKTPAAIRFLSCEPLLGPIDFTPPQWRGTNVNLNDWLQCVDWVIVGGESGTGARPMHPEWARRLRDACVNRTDMGRPWSLPFFFKQWGGWKPARAGDIRLDGNRICMNADGRHQWIPSTPGYVVFERVGKKTAGRELDGRTWDEMPRQGVRA